jgi:hypothetical protein
MQKRRPAKRGVLASAGFHGDGGVSAVGGELRWIKRRERGWSCERDAYTRPGPFDHPVCSILRQQRPGSPDRASEIGNPFLTVLFTTVATAFALGQFVGRDGIAGRAPGLQNAAAMPGDLVNVGTGGLSRILSSPQNGHETSTRAFNTLANMDASCAGLRNDRGLYARRRQLAPRDRFGPAGQHLDRQLRERHCYSIRGR